MTTTRAAPEAVLPPAQTEMERLAERVERAEAVALQKLWAYCSAFRAANGCAAGPELDKRLMATKDAGMALRSAGYDWMDSKTALTTALNQPRED